MLLRRLCHLPGAVLRALCAAMNAAPSRIVIPDSCRSNFQPFYLHPPDASLSLRSLSPRRSGREVAALPSRVGFRLGLRHSLAGSPMHLAVSSSSFSYLWTGCSLPAALHPASRRRSCLQLRTASALSDGDSHPAVGAHSQAHEGCASLAAVVGQFRRHDRKRCAIWRDAVACAVMSSFITPADAKAIDKAFREYKDAEQALHKAFLYRRPIEEIGSDIRTFQEKDASWASLREKFYQR